MTIYLLLLSTLRVVVAEMNEIAVEFRHDDALSGILLMLNCLHYTILYYKDRCALFRILRRAKAVALLKDGSPLRWTCFGASLAFNIHDSTRD